MCFDAIMSMPQKLAVPTDVKRRCLSAGTGVADEMQLTWEKHTVCSSHSVNNLFSLLFYFHKPQFYILLFNCNIGMFTPFYVMKLTEHILHFVHLIFTTQRTWCITEIDNTLLLLLL